MAYPYSKYRDGADANAHIRDFLKTWEINHGAQRMSSAAEDKSVYLTSLHSIRTSTISLIERSTHLC